LFDAGFKSLLAVSIASNTQTYGNEVSVGLGSLIMANSAEISAPNIIFKQNDALTGSSARRKPTGGMIMHDDKPIVGDLNFEDNKLMILAAAMGAQSTPSQLSGAAYTSTFSITDSLSHFFTLAIQRLVDAVNCPNGIFVYPWTIAKEITLTMNEDIWTMSASLVADQVVLASTVITSLAAVTSPTYVDPMQRWQTIVRMNDNSGGALSASDEIKVKTLEFKFVNNLDVQGASGSRIILQPDRKGFKEVSCNITYPRTTDYQMLADYLAETSKKMDITVTGPQIGATGYYYSFQINLPNILATEDSLPIASAELIEQTVNFECNKSNGPTGMESITDEFNVVVQNTKDVAYF